MSSLPVSHQPGRAGSIALNDGSRIPRTGFGTFPMNDAEIAAFLPDVLGAGYRLIDTAYKYGNESGIGLGLRNSDVQREEIYLQTKLNGDFQGDDRAWAGLQGCLDRLGVDHVDMLLIHWPLPGRGRFVDTWKTFEDIARSGKARSIGVSNFEVLHLQALLDRAEIAPAVNQIQLSPEHPRRALRRFMTDAGIVAQAWGPIGRGGTLLSAPSVAALARAHDATPAQIVLQWHLAQEIVPITRTSHAYRLVENLDADRVTLTEADLASLDLLDKGGEGLLDPESEGH